MLKRTLEHWVKHGAKFLMAVFAHWKALSKINDTKKSIAALEYQMGDTSIAQQGTTADFEKERADLIAKTAGINGEFDQLVIKRSKVMALMVDTNQNNHFQSRFRSIFLGWRAHTKR